MKLAVVAAVLALAGAVVPDETKFRYERTLPAPAGVLVAFEPDGLLFFHSKPGFADLRVLDRGGVQVPWRPLPEVEEGEQAAQVLNSGRRGGAAVALLDLGPGRGLYDRIELQVTARNFVGRVTVSGSDRRQGSFTRLSSTGIYDIEGARSARSTTAVVPPSDFRFLSLRATGVDQIDGALVSGAGGRERLAGRRYELLRGSGGQGSKSEYLLDFGVPGLPVTELALSSTSETYERPVLVEGSNSRNRFELVTRARIFRFSGSRSAPVSFLSHFRYLRVTIDNGDDAPLEGVALEARGPSSAILLEPGHRGPFRLLYGGPEVTAPSYEFARIPAPAPATVLPPSRLRPERLNAAFEPPADDRSLGERNPRLIQGALALAAFALLVGGFLALRRRT
jgi:hypothetical protein